MDVALVKNNYKAGYKKKALYRAETIIQEEQGCWLGLRRTREYRLNDALGQAL